MVREAPLRRVELAALRQPLVRELAQHFQHRDARLSGRILDERNHVLIHERRELSEYGALAVVANCGGSEVEASARTKDGEPPKGVLFFLREQIVTPRDRAVHR